jgi:hypothetical protein
MYLGGTVYRIHSTNAPETIGTHVSSGCIRLTNEDVTGLYSRVSLGAKVIALADVSPRRSRSPDALTHCGDQMQQDRFLAALRFSLGCCGGTP